MWLPSLLLPSRCACCGAPGRELCAACAAALRRLPATHCARCGAPTVVSVARCRECSGRRLAFAQARAAIVYDTRARKLLGAWKEQGVRRLAPHAGRLLLEIVPRPDVAALVPVPADGERALRRGPHPADQLAELLADAWSLPVGRSLARTGVRPRQRSLAVAERRRNVRDAFLASASPATVALVDDVYTTGATLDAAARALRHAGADRVVAVTLARVCRHR